MVFEAQTSRAKREWVARDMWPGVSKREPMAVGSFGGWGFPRQLVALGYVLCKRAERKDDGGGGSVQYIRAAMSAGRMGCDPQQK